MHYYKPPHSCNVTYSRFIIWRISQYFETIVFQFGKKPQTFEGNFRDSLLRTYLIYTTVLMASFFDLLKERIMSVKRGVAIYAFTYMYCVSKYELSRNTINEWKSRFPFWDEEILAKTGYGSQCNGYIVSSKHIHNLHTLKGFYYSCCHFEIKH